LLRRALLDTLASCSRGMMMMRMMWWWTGGISCWFLLWVALLSKLKGAGGAGRRTVGKTVGFARSIRTAQEATTSRSTKARIPVQADAWLAVHQFSLSSLTYNKREGFTVCIYIYIYIGAVWIQGQMAKGQMVKFLLLSHQMFGR
jgi:hypothetical protein